MTCSYFARNTDTVHGLLWRLAPDFFFIQAVEAGKMLKILILCFSGGMLKQTMTCFRVFCSFFLSVANPYLIETAASHCWSIAMGRTGTSAEGACHPLRRGAKAPDGTQVRLMPVTEFGQGIRAPSVLELERRQTVLH